MKIEIMPTLEMTISNLRECFDDLELRINANANMHRFLIEDMGDSDIIDFNVDMLKAARTQLMGLYSA